MQQRHGRLPIHRACGLHASHSWPAYLRRAGVTMMWALGISLGLIDRCQSHVLPGSKVRWHCMLHDYADEKRAAWVALGARLAAVRE